MQRLLRCIYRATMVAMILAFARRLSCKVLMPKVFMPKGPRIVRTGGLRWSRDGFAVAVVSPIDGMAYTVGIYSTELDAVVTRHTYKSYGRWPEVITYPVNAGDIVKFYSIKDVPR